jgi:hypothetical protein
MKITMAKIQSVLIMMIWWIIVSEAMDYMGSKREMRRKREHLIQNEEGDRKAIQMGAARQNG